MPNQSKSNNSSKKTAAQLAAEGRATRQRYEKTKEKVWNYEKRNREKLIIFRSTNGWWKIGGVSALAYKNALAPRLGKDPILRDDMDFYSIFADGIISIPNIDIFKKEVSELGLKISHETEEWISFDLNWKISKSELNRWREAEKAKRDKLGKMIMPKVMDPNLWVEIVTMARIVYENIRKENPIVREYHGRRILRETDKIVETYVRMSNGAIDAEEALRLILDSANELTVMMIMIVEMGLWKYSAQSRMMLQLEKIKAYIEEKNDKE